MSESREALRDAVLAVIRKEKGEFCVKSPENPKWDGGCYDSKAEAEERLKQVEYFKHKEAADRVAYFYQDRMARRVAGRFMFTAALHDELVRRMDGLFSSFNGTEASELAQWFKDNFRFDSPKTPQGQKDLKAKASKLHWFLQDASDKKDYQGKILPGNQRSAEEAERIWKSDIKPVSGDLVRYFTDEGGKIVPKEVQSGSNTYVNLVGFDQKKLGQYVTAMETVLDEIKGWRRKALTGGVRVVLAGPKEFRGTATGTYRSSEDALYIRATPNVLKRSRGTYAAFDYIVVHELGHRYERKNNVPFDFDRPEWQTSAYSKKDGESFAELYAISNFNLKGAWDDAVVERFEALMEGKSVAAATRPAVSISASSATVSV